MDSINNTAIGGAAGDEILSPEAAAIALRCSAATLQRWRTHGVGPDFVRLGPKRVGYRRSALGRFQQSQTNTAGAHAAPAVDAVLA